MDKPMPLFREVIWPENCKVHFPESKAFADATLRWSTYKPPNFAAVAVPQNEDAVATIVKTARTANIPFLATGGHHGYGTTLGTLQNGLAIDLRQLKGQEIDKAAGTITVGAGTLIGDVIGPVHDAGFALPVGSCMEVGLIGATLGAGVGIFQGLLGLIIDSLVSVRLVTADGNLVEASEDLNPDLFWGIRGAGANFGIVTSATYKLHDAVDINNGQVMTTDLVFPAHMKSDYFKTLESFEDKWPAELAGVSTIAWNADSEATQVIATFVYCGPEAEGRKVLAPFFDLDPPAVRVSMTPYNKVASTIVFGMIPTLSPPGSIRDIITVNIRKLDADTFISAFEKFDAFYRANPDGRTSAGLFETFSNHAVTAVPNDATAYPWRDAKGNLIFQMAWPEGKPVEEAANALGRELRSEFAATSGYPDLSVYVSYAWGDETLEQIYGKEKLPRLAALKKEWDPDNVFRYNHALPTEYP